MQKTKRSRKVKKTVAQKQAAAAKAQRIRAKFQAQLRASEALLRTALGAGFGEVGSVLRATETLVDRAEWLLRELEPMSNKPINEMEPPDGLKIDLGFRDIEFRSLSGSMHVYIVVRNPEEGVTNTEVTKAKTIRGELKLLQKKIEGAEPSDPEADFAIIEARGRF